MSSRQLRRRSGPSCAAPPRDARLPSSRRDGGNGLRKCVVSSTAIPKAMVSDSTVVSCSPAPVIQSQASVPRIGNRLGIAVASATRQDRKAKPIRNRLTSTEIVRSSCRPRTIWSVAIGGQDAEAADLGALDPRRPDVGADRSSTSRLSSSDSMMVGMKPVTSACMPSSVTKRRFMNAPTALKIWSRVKPESLVVFVSSRPRRPCSARGASRRCRGPS